MSIPVTFNHLLLSLSKHGPRALADPTIPNALETETKGIVLC